MKKIIAVALLLLPAPAAATGMAVQSVAPTDDRTIYPTFGVHNPPQYSPCAAPDCLNRRGPGEPSDPLYPESWVSDWIMYRVFRNYETFPPPYSSPPEGLSPDDYEVSQGTTYYDATYRNDSHPGVGAMMEHYVRRCLPIFPIDNHFTCSFISLGDTAWFLTYPEDRPADMPPCCLFSELNHPPRRDFVKHLPYSPADSARVKDVQAYSLTTPGPDGPILFGYAFEGSYRADAEHPEAGSYRHPQSFYFSGDTNDPPQAPIVSQNYTNFSAAKPDPAQTWDQIGQYCSGTVPKCELFR